jgi:hypothetical protein
VNQDFEKQSEPKFKMTATKAAVVLAAGAAISSMSAICSPVGAYVGQVTVVSSVRQDRFADGELAPVNQWADVISMIRSRPNISEQSIDDPDPAF